MSEYKIISSSDGTKRIEFEECYIAVIIPTKDGKNTICVSCQIGCPVGCKFCLTGKMGFKRNLTKEEIVEQVEIAQKIIGKKPSTIVFMGMGEPTLNLKNVFDAAESFHRDFRIGLNHITISTSCLENLDILTRIPYNIALSLHSPFDKKRKEIISSGTSVKKIVSFTKKYLKNRSKKRYVMIEYALIEGVNDSEKDLKKLGSFKWPKNTLFNLIQFNEFGNYKRSSDETALKFKDFLIKKGWKCFIRLSRGRDIGASCGMLES